MVPILYYRFEDGAPYDNFCSDAAIGARELGIQARPYEYDLPEFSPYNIVVTTVEETQEYLGRTIPPIDREWSKRFERRVVKKMYISEITEYPCFIKPAEEIKAWTGVVVENADQARFFTKDYQLPVLVSEVKNIESEYRVYCNKLRGILGIKHYLGDPFIILSESFVQDCVGDALEHLSENSFTLDFGVDDMGETFLIEINDGWAVGNYGLPPKQYYSFVKNRFLQLSGVLK